MQDFAAWIQAIVALLQTEFTIYGFTLSWWQVFLWTTVAGLILWFIREVFFGD